MQPLIVVAGLVLSYLCAPVQSALTKDQLLQTVQNSKRKLLPVNDANYETILNGKRDYHVVVFFTSEAPQINCVLCKEIAPEFELIADSWFKDHPHGVGIGEGEGEEIDADGNKVEPKKNVFFFKSEFADSRKFFSLFGLNNIPKIFHFAPTKAKGPNNFLKERTEYQFFQGDHKSLMVNWLSDLTGHSYNLYIPIDRTRLVINVVVGFVGALLAKRFKKQIFGVLLSRLVWIGVSIVSVLLFTTGYMFNKIRGSPYLIEHPDGRTEYFIGGQQTQLGIETQIISFIYGLMSILVIILIKRAPEIKTPSINLILVAVISGLIFLLFSLLLSIFGLKGLGFPYRFIKFF
ncbi:uncharacterized protein LODBEIA_P54540 [Lodderomyces beijingensis]|uniref:Uncharacterized protein n=1 Tax=Lodderomyces beijingensis TaxID=1775926 RepID=A0ABP0ZSW6_9ASCO